VALEIDGIPAILDLVARGHGFAVLSLNAIRRDPLRAQLLPRAIVKPRLVTTLAIATSAQRPLTPLARQVAELLREVVPRELAERGA
jgi:LysR family nitrogen assimilation transcriptional regulator